MTSTCTLHQPAIRFFCIYLCPFFLQCRKRCQDAFCTSLPHTEISPAPRPLTGSTFTFIYYFNITFFVFSFCVSQHLAASRGLWSPRLRLASWWRNPRHAPPAPSWPVGRLQAATLTSFLHFFSKQSWVKPNFSISQGHFVIVGLLSPLHLPVNQWVSLEMNEWERERRRTNTLQSPGEGNAWAASSLGSIPSSKGCAFHIPAGLPTPGCTMHWAGVSTYSLSVHDQKFLFAKREVGANPSCSSKQFPSQCIGIFPPPKAFHESFPAHSLLWPLKAMSVTQCCFSSWSQRSGFNPIDSNGT